MIVHDWQENPTTETSDRAERALLGTCLVYPPAVGMTSTLRLGDFRSSRRAKVLETMRRLEEDAPGGWDSVIVAHALESRAVDPPSGSPGWCSALGELMDNTCVDDDVIRAYVRVIIEAAAIRRATRPTLRAVE